MKRLFCFLLAACLGALSAFAGDDVFIGELSAAESGIGCDVQTLLARSDEALSPAFQLGKAYTVKIKELYDCGVDLAFRLSKKCFLDHISLNLSGDCEGARAQVFCGDRPITPETALHAGENTLVPAWHVDGFILRIRKDVGYVDTPALEVVKKEYRNFKITELHLFGACNMEKPVYPFPQKIVREEGWLETVTGVKAPGKEFAGSHFCERYAQRFGRKLKEGKGNVVFGLDRSLEKESFTIQVTPSGANLRGGSSRALLYAAEKLLQLCDGEGRIRCASIQDAPAFPFRGIHVSLPKRAQHDFLRRLVKYVLLPMGYNTVFLEIRGTMELKRHPEINRANCPKPSQVISQQEVADLCAYMRRYGMDIIPLVQSFGHTQHITKAHPELAEKAAIEKEEVNLLEADKRSTAKDAHTSCPNQPGYFPLFFDLLDEVIDVVKPDGYVNIGHDEIYEVGRCPLCKAEGAASVYAREVTTLHDYIAKKGYGTMMWSDMITEKRYPTRPAIDMIPKDIVCLPFTWYFHLGEDGDSEQPLVEHGFRYMIGNLYSSHFPRFEQRRKNPGFLGGEVSYWQLCEEDPFGYQGKMYDLVYTAGMLWNLSYRDDFRRTYNEIVRDILPGIRADIHYGKRLREIPGETFVPEGGKVPFALSDNFSTVAFAGKDGDAVLPLKGVRADRFHIVHATDHHAVEGLTQRPLPDPSGKYILEYEDGTQAEEPLVYGLTLGWYDWAFGAPRRSSVFRHYGYVFTYPSAGISLKTGDGHDATVWDYTLDNPHPDKAVKALRISFDGKNSARLMLFSVQAASIKEF